VLSIGNIAVGGRAKTPLTAYIAMRLLALGERPAILSRGYARRDLADGVVVVRDPGGIRADLDRAGDEPLMLARQLDGVAVLASASRYLAGRLAEHHFGCTVHVLDDGFQHFYLHRDADLVVVTEDDVKGARTLPSGRLREPIDVIEHADALVALDGADVGPISNGRPVWRAVRRIGSAPLEPAFALAGIASSRVFVESLRTPGAAITGEMLFKDHHRYTRADLDRIVNAARAAGAATIVTTEKDLVRLLPFRPFAMPIHAVPLTIEIDDAKAFDTWLRETIEKARA
jgi:tetraacyldisaccharide 4'-kinase